MIENQNISKLIADWKLISLEIKEMKNKYNRSIGFNVFKLISAKDYRENFHSHIIFKIFQVDEGNLIKLFIEMINLKLKVNGDKINLADFSCADVKKEYSIEGKRRIDILIYDTRSKRAIIIENKMNNAIDQPRQIADYYNCISTGELGKLEVISIVYIPLVGNKHPSYSDWKPEEIKEIEPKIVVIPAFSTDGINLVENWIEHCIKASNQINFQSTLTQYKERIMELANGDKIIEENLPNFYELIKNGGRDSLISASSIYQMMARLSEYRSKRIIMKFDNDANMFKAKSYFYNEDRNVWVAKFHNFRHQTEIDLALRIECKEETYAITLNEGGKTFDKSKDKLSDFLTKKGMSVDFEMIKNDEWRFKTIFSFPTDDSNLDTEIRKILVQLNK